MYDLDKAYSKKFFARRKSLAWRIPIVCDAIIDVLKPKSVIDVGCGNGDLIEGFLKRSISAQGMEGTVNSWFKSIVKDRIHIQDLRIPLIMHQLLSHFNLKPRKFDLAICFEVAEHIEPEYTDIFLDNLCSVSDRVLFSAASPGQGGIHHHNCQYQDYWQQRFNKRQYYMKSHTVDKLRRMWHPWRNKKGIKAYYQNLMYFEKK